MASSIAPARLAAFQILREIRRNHGNSDILLNSAAIQSLSPLDRNLCTALVLGVLRWQIVLDRAYRCFLDRPEKPLEEDTELALRLGAFQMLFMDRIPARAAIFESVEWMKRSVVVKDTGLVNAILRKIAARPAMDRSPEFAYPQWMRNRWREFYGSDASQKICDQGQQEPRTALRLISKGAEDELRSAGLHMESGQFLKNARFASSVDSRFVPEPDCALIQDEGSQLVAELLGTGKRILDCCAAPGNKTAILRQNNPEAEMIVCDTNPKRLAAMRNRLEKILNPALTQFRVADATTLADFGWFDRILCDVPCSGTGTLARNPEIRHRLRVDDFARHAERQCNILSNALRLLAPGGRLLYSTCSLEPEENESVVEACLNKAGDSGLRLTRLSVRTEFEGLLPKGTVTGNSVELLRDTAFLNDYLRTIPGVHPCDGFFAALIEKA